jgi:uncharacterized protein (TIGR02217 family)
MSFLESPRFPERLSVGLAGGPAFATEIAALASGQEQRNRLWSQARRRYALADTPKPADDTEELIAFGLSLGGPAWGFRFKDRQDFRSDSITLGRAGGGLVALRGGVESGAFGVGHGEPVLQLAKRYAVGAASHVRLIRKPVAGSVTVRRNGTPVTVGPGAGQIALDTTTGLITFEADQSRGIASHTVGAAHQVTLASALAPNLSVGGRLYLSGVTGTAAAVLNGLSHAITGVAGATLTLGTSTVGLTASAGTAAAYPQPTETLAAAFEFDVPVRFADDNALTRIVLISSQPSGAAWFSWSGIELVEIKV